MRDAVILHLVLAGQWYDMMLGGVKDVEYRAVKPHWTRLIWSRRQNITHVRCARGYTQTTILRSVRSIDIGSCPYEGWDGNFYRLHLEPIRCKGVGARKKGEG